MTNPSFISSSGFNLSYILIEGKEPYITYFHGSRSSKDATKSKFLQEVAKKTGCGFFSFDYTGHGDAEGDYEQDGSISTFKQDVTSALKFLNKKTVIVASSMGFWLFCLICEDFKNQITAGIGISSAPDFTIDIQKMLNNNPEYATDNGDYINFKTLDGFEHKFMKKFLDDGGENTVLDKKINFDKDVILIHGDKDDWVDWKKIAIIKDSFSSSMIKMIIVKGGEHRMDKPHELSIIEQEALNFLK